MHEAANQLRKLAGRSFGVRPREQVVASYDIPPRHTNECTSRGLGSAIHIYPTAGRRADRRTRRYRQPRARQPERASAAAQRPFRC